MYIELVEEGPLGHWLQAKAAGHCYRIYHYKGTEKYRIDIHDKSGMRVMTREADHDNDTNARDWGYMLFVEHLTRNLFVTGEEDEL